MKYKFCHNCHALNRLSEKHLADNTGTCGKCGMPLGDLREADKLTETQTEKLIRNSNNLVVVDIFADWCGPCQSYGPIFSKVGAQNYTKAEFVKLNADQAPNFSARYDIRGVPATLFFKNGQLVAQQRGLLNEVQLTQQVQSLS